MSGESDKQQLYDPIYCRNMAQYHELIADNYHEDGYLDECRQHRTIASNWKAIALKLEGGKT